MLITYIALWWRVLLHPDHAAQLVSTGGPPGFFRFLSASIFIMYAVYGASMGLFQGLFAGLVSALKLPFLFSATLLVCFPAFYVANCLVGPRLPTGACVRLLLLAISTNAIALSSYAPLSYFFTFTTSEDGYAFIVFMHVVVFALAALVSLAVITAIFRAAATATRRIRPVAVWVWGILYGLVGSEMAWVLRPWIGWGELEYAPFRPFQESFSEAFFRVLRLVF